MKRIALLFLILSCSAISCRKIQGTYCWKCVTLSSNPDFVKEFDKCDKTEHEIKKFEDDGYTFSTSSNGGETEKETVPMKCTKQD